MKRSFKVGSIILISFLLSGCEGTPSGDHLLFLAAALIIAINALFVILAIYSNILRDEVSNTNEFDKNAQKIQQKQNTRFVDRDYPFSLTKVQFGLWTVIISSCYIYLALCKGDCAETSINKTALVLMGIFAGTAAASNLMDKREINDNRPRHQNSPSEGFFIDILSDDNGISLHRFQSLVWTLIAVTIYIYKVYSVQLGCVLPELSDTLLSLTGISSATYLVLRSKENDPPAMDTREANPPANLPQGNPVADPAKTIIAPDEMHPN